MLKSRDKSRTHGCTMLSIEWKARQSRPTSWMGELRPVWIRDLLKPGLCGQKTLFTESGGGYQVLGKALTYIFYSHPQLRRTASSFLFGR